MHRPAPRSLALLFGLLAVLAAACSSEPEASRKTQDDTPRPHANLTFNGGPMGGTFNFFANKMAFMISKSVPWMNILARGSAGSMENICALNLNQADMGILYAGDAFLGRHGKLDRDDTGLDRVRTLAFLYGAPAQLVVRGDSDIKSVADLKGRIVAVGNPGSGAALSAERFFRHLGLWDEIDHRNLGYSRAAAAFGAGKIDAFWVLVGYPNSSIVEASTHTPIRLIDLREPSISSRFFDLYPFYTSVTIPTGTYEGQNEPVATFQDSALWCVRADLDPDVAYQSLKVIFSPEGLAEMHQAHQAAKSISVDRSLDSLAVPLHPGAARFWADQGLHIPVILLP